MLTTCHQGPPITLFSVLYWQSTLCQWTLQCNVHPTVSNSMVSLLSKMMAAHHMTTEVHHYTEPGTKHARLSRTMTTTMSSIYSQVTIDQMCTTASATSPTPHWKEHSTVRPLSLQTTPVTNAQNCSGLRQRENLFRLRDKDKTKLKHCLTAGLLPIAYRDHLWYTPATLIWKHTSKGSGTQHICTSCITIVPACMYLSIPCLTWAIQPCPQL